MSFIWSLFIMAGLFAAKVQKKALEGRALINDPVGHFSEGARLQGKQQAVVGCSMRHGARGMEHGCWQIVVLMCDPGVVPNNGKLCYYHKLLILVEDQIIVEQ